MMKFKFFTLLVFSFIGFSLHSLPVFAHTLTTATGHPVDHIHSGYCGPTGCPITDMDFENLSGFRPEDRVYSGTGSWNCHGRTFDNRRSWISQAMPFWNYDSPVCPASPQRGDTILFWDGGEIIHSATMVETWNGTSTLIMSKYGKQGQYQHALANSIKIYGKNWSIIRFTAGTLIPQALQRNNSLRRLLTGLPIPNLFVNPILGEKMDPLKERKKMPWYQDVLSSQEIYETEHPKMVAKIATMKPEKLAQYQKTESLEGKISILMEDLLDDIHYQFLGVYDSPAYCTDFIHAIQAANLLVNLSMTESGARTLIINELKKNITALEISPEFDKKRGAMIYFLGKILNQNEKVLLRDQLLKTFGQFRAPKGLPPTYTEYYLDRW